MSAVVAGVGDHSEKIEPVHLIGEGCLGIRVGRMVGRVTGRVVGGLIGGVERDMGIIACG